MITITYVEPRPRHNIRITFSDGMAGDIGVESLIHDGVFCAIAAAREFRKVKIGDGGRSLVWPGDIDLCADALYQGLTGHLPWEGKAARTPSATRGKTIVAARQRP